MTPAVTRPKILNIRPTFSVGGAEIRTCALINHFGDKYENILVAEDGRFDACERIDPAIKFQTIAAPHWSKNPFLRILEIRRFINEINPDVVITNNWGSIEYTLAQILNGKRALIHTEEGFNADEAARLKPHRTFLRRLILPHTDAVFVPSQNLCDIARKIWGLRGEKIRYIPNGICLDGYPEYAHTCKLPDVDLSKDIVVIGTVATIRPVKNLPRLLQAVAQLPDNVHLVIIGDGPAANDVKAKAKDLKLGNRVTFCGHLNEPGRYIGHFDIFAMSSDSEQMPMSLIEAMAANLPVMSTDVGDIKTMVCPDNRAYITPLGNDDAYAAALRTLCEDHGLRKSIGEQNQQKAFANYTVEKMANEHDQMIRDALRSRR